MKGNPMTDRVNRDELIARLRGVRKNNPFAGHADLCDEAANALEAARSLTDGGQEDNK